MPMSSRSLDHGNIDTADHYMIDDDDDEEKYSTLPNPSSSRNKRKEYTTAHDEQGVDMRYDGNDDDDADDADEDTNTTKSRKRQFATNADTSDNFFVAKLAWALKPVACDSWARANAHLGFCTLHKRLFDVQKPRKSTIEREADVSCTLCGYIGNVGPSDTSIESQLAYHNQTYPMAVKYESNNAASNEAASHAWEEACNRYIKAIKADEKLHQQSAELAMDATRELKGEAVTIRQEHLDSSSNLHFALVAYEQYAWNVARDYRKALQASGRLDPSTPPHVADREAAGDRITKAFLRKFQRDMIEANYPSIGQIYCLRHMDHRATWINDAPPSNFLDCGLCRRPLPAGSN